MSHTRTHILKSVNISWKWIAWPVFLLSVYFLVHSFTAFINQHRSVSLLHLHVTTYTIGLVAVVLLLCIVNWWLESFKWKIMVNQITPCKFRTAAHSVLMGCSFGFITPNRVGDYAGRTIPFHSSLQPQLVTLNIISGFSQFLAVVGLGLGCMFFYSHSLVFQSAGAIWLAATTVAGIFVLFVLMARCPQQFTRLMTRVGLKHKLFQQAFAFPVLNKKIIASILLVSVIRAVVFVLQLMLVIQILAPQVSMAQAGVAGGVYFAVLTVSPSLVFNKLGLREALSVLILAPVLSSPVVAAVAVFALWFINQVIPVLLGSVLLIKRSVQA